VAKVTLIGAGSMENQIVALCDDLIDAHSDLLPEGIRRS
jgi:hypothetical protein